MAAFSQTIEFIENKGQWDPQVKFMGRVPAGAFFVHPNGFTVLQHNTKDWETLTEAMHHHALPAAGGEAGRTAAPIQLRSHAYRVSFLGGAARPQLIADKPVSSYNNYFIGNDPSKWAANCKIYQGVTLKDVYPNVDVRYYSGQGSVKYDIIVHPGGKISDIALKYEGAEGLEVKGKELVIRTSVGDLKERDPYTYQYNHTGRVSRTTRYTVKDNVVRFAVKDHDPSTTLVIDPDLIFCSFSGSTEDNWGFTATNGPDGSMFGGGIVFGSGFPTTTGAVQTTFGGGGSNCFGAGQDIGIIKLSPDGKNRIYATYIGGNGNELPQSLVVDPNGNLILAGRSNSAKTGAGAYPLQGPNSLLVNGGTANDYDIVVTKLNAAGTALIGSKRIGGEAMDGVNISECAGNGASSLIRNYGDEGRGEVNIDAAGNIYVATSTQSNNFFTRNPVQATYGGGVQDGAVLKFDPTLSNLLFSTYLGGSGDDAAYVVSIHPQNGNIYVAGGTASPNLPGTTPGVIGQNSFGAIDGYVSILSPDGAALVRTSYIGTGGVDQIYGLQFDGNGFPYVMGQTTGSWPLINAAWSQPNGKQFIAKMQPDLSAYVYSTMFGKGQAVPDISPVAFLVDRCENVYISGWGGRIGNTPTFPNAGVLGLPVTPDAFKPVADPGTSGTGEDFYFFVLKKDAVSQLYGSFFGQNNGVYPDHVDGGTSRFDRNGVIYQAICASCGVRSQTAPLPTFPGDVWAVNKPESATCNLAMLKIAFKFAGAVGDVRPSINGVPRDSTGCVPLTVDFTDTVQEASKYEWYFGDGTDTVTVVPSVTHTYYAVGSYRVMMVAIDSTKCFPRDTSYVTVKVGDNQAIPQFRAVKLSPPCDTFRYRFENTTIAPPGIPFKPTSFTWDFGDGSPTVQGGSNAVFHTYANAGTYVVKLTLNDTSYCNSPETYIDTLRVAANVKAVFATAPRGCAPYEAVFSNQSVGGSRFVWDFGDGTGATSPPASPTHIYTSPGTYTVTLTAIDSNTCNIVDRTSFTITVAAAPTAFFTFAPRPPQVNTPISYTNLSSADAIRFKWLWGDGDSIVTASRGLVQHEFNLEGTYNTCLVATNAAGCEARYCEDVRNLVDPAVDVPNAFTPQSGDVNSRVFVRGFGITKLRFAIYARWGEKVFETADKRIGWDGRYKGQLLPMDVYAYTLDVELADGKKFQKKGDITLIR